jgi:hypothetical protein
MKLAFNISICSKNLITALLLTLAIVNASWGCEFDTDCNPGNTCLKSSSSIYGICTGGINPGNNNDQQPVYSSMDPNNTTGNTCSFDTDCGPGSTCLKGNGAIEGACVHS